MSCFWDVKPYDFLLHPDVSATCRALAQSGEFPHLLIYGPPGAGKRTLVTGLLHDLFPLWNGEASVVQRTFSVSGEKPLVLSLLHSAHHIEINPSELRCNKDRLVVQELVKEIAENRMPNVAFKVLIIHQAECLSGDAQSGLRRIMEMYMKNCRMVLICDNPLTLIEPIRSRCMAVRVSAPSPSQMGQLLAHIAKREQLVLPSATCQSIIESSGRNMRTAILMLQCSRVLRVDWPTHCDWETRLHTLASSMVKARRAASSVRQELLQTFSDVPVKRVLKTLGLALCSASPGGAVSARVCHLLAQKDYEMSKGNQPFLYLDSFLASVACVLD